MPRPRLEFRVARAATAGARPYQEDWSGEQWLNGATGGGLLAVVADGMGGHVSGEVASSRAGDRFLRAFSELGLAPGERLKEALVLANKALADEIRQRPNLNGMGCTLVAGYFDQDGLRWASVGDSALLHYRGGKLVRRNANHGMAELLDRQVQAGRMSQAEAMSDPRRRTLRSALTGNPIPLEQIVPEPQPLEPGDWLLIASDGLETLSGHEIATLIKQNADGEPEALARALIEQVMARKLPHQDNTTVVAIRVLDAASAPARPSQNGRASIHDDETAPPAQPVTVAVAGRRHARAAAALPDDDPDATQEITPISDAALRPARPARATRERTVNAALLIGLIAIAAFFGAWAIFSGRDNGKVSPPAGAADKASAGGADQPSSALIDPVVPGVQRSPEQSSGGTTGESRPKDSKGGSAATGGGMNRERKP